MRINSCGTASCHPLPLLLPGTHSMAASRGSWLGHFSSALAVHMKIKPELSSQQHMILTPPNIGLTLLYYNFVKAPSEKKNLELLSQQSMLSMPPDMGLTSPYDCMKALSYPHDSMHF